MCTIRLLKTKNINIIIILLINSQIVINPYINILHHTYKPLSQIINN